MIHQDRVRDMTRLAMLESEMGREVTKVCSYRRVDYVIAQILKGVIAGSVCFAALMVLWFAFIWDDINLYFADARYVEFLLQVLKYYGIFMIFYLGLCAVVGAVRYNRCGRTRKKYLRYIKNLEKSYSEDGESR